MAAADTPAAMDELHAAFLRTRDAGEHHPLLVIGCYVLDFLAIHPFSDGNGRMARLLTLLLLYQSGYDVGRYVSLERLVNDAKVGYYCRCRPQASDGTTTSTHLAVARIRPRDPPRRVPRVRGSRGLVEPSDSLIGKVLARLRDEGVIEPLGTGGRRAGADAEPFRSRAAARATSPRHVGGRFSRKAHMPSWASSARAFIAMTALVRS